MSDEEIVSVFLESSSKDVERTINEIKEIQKSSNEQIRKVIALL